MNKRSFFAPEVKLYYNLLEEDIKKPVIITTPCELILFIDEPLDSTKINLIKVKDEVSKGAKLYLYNDSTEYTICPVAGEISKMDTFTNYYGKIITLIKIKNNFDKTDMIGVKTYDMRENLVFADNYLRSLPNSSLPLKTLIDENYNINTIIIACADSSLLSTSNQYFGLKFSDKIKKAVKILRNMTSIVNICITIPEEFSIPACFEGITIIKTQRRYPLNSPSMILKNHLSLILNPGEKPEDKGVCFVSAETAIALVDTYDTKIIETQKTLSIIDKQGEIHRAKATIGTPLSALFNEFKIHINHHDRVVVGCPMTGYSIYSTQHPVEPDMDIILVQDKDYIEHSEDNSCVNCGKCVRVCPAKVPVNMLIRYLKAFEYEQAADKYDLISCIDCGLCSYVCTARIPVYQYIRLGKQELEKIS